MTYTIWLSFALVCLIFSLSPGPSAISMMSHALSISFKRCIVHLIGLELGLLIYIILVIGGISSFIVNSEIIFDILKYSGACYLIFLGILKFKKQQTIQLSLSKQSNWQLFITGLMIDLTNIKTIIFLLAFIPQFINYDNLTINQYIIVGLTILVFDIIAMIIYGVIANITQQYLKSSKIINIVYKIFGVLFILIAFSILDVMHWFG